jgi:hypothetical protein
MDWKTNGIEKRVVRLETLVEVARLQSGLQFKQIHLELEPGGDRVLSVMGDHSGNHFLG